MDLQIEQMVYGGSGLSRMENGRIVLVPFTLPGEIVRVEMINEKNTLNTALPDSILRTNDHRLAAPCPYYTLCGGCHYQHARYDFQVDIKRDIVLEQLKRLGDFSNPPVENTIGSPRPFGYRNHVQFHLDGLGRPGFQKALSHEVIPIENCLILESPLNELLKTLSFDPDAGLKRVAIRDDGLGIPLLFMSGEQINPPEFEVDFPLNVVYRGPAGDMVLSGEGFNTFEILGKEFQVSAGSFFQTNRDIAAEMVKLILEKTHLEKKFTVLDCYCGVGFFSAFMAEKTSRLIGIESSEDACTDFVVNLDQYDQVELYQGNVEVVLPELDIHPDIAVIDPPRAGMAPAAIKALIKSCPAQIVYISCDPSTQARDLKTLKNAGYNLASITPLDMFPQTYHIETISFLDLKAE